MRKKDIGSLIVIGIIIIVVNVANIMVKMNANEMIVQYGIRGYRSLNNVVGTMALIATLACIACGGFILTKNMKKQITEPETRQDGMLSGTLSDAYIMGELIKQSQGKWQALQDEIGALSEQLSTMNAYQDRLARLLMNNSAKALSDTEGILERIEQEILGNVRNVLNFMEVLGVDDKQEVRNHIAVCVRDNKKLLDATKDFLVCLTGFLNDQGSSGSNIEMVEQYKDILVGNLASPLRQQNENISLKL